MKSIQNEINEKCYLIKNDISVKDEITPKVAAEFAVTFYKIYRDDYDEKTFVNIVKKVMEFFNKSILDIPKKKVLTDAKKILNEMDSLKESVRSFSKIFVNKTESRFYGESFTTVDLELCESQFKELKKNLKVLELNKPFILFRWNWKRKIKKELFKLNSLEGKTIKVYDYFYETNRERNEILEEMYLDIRKNLKSFMQDVKPTIGEELADIPYEHAVETVDDLKSFVFDVIISNFYQYYTLRSEK